MSGPVALTVEAHRYGDGVSVLVGGIAPAGEIERIAAQAAAATTFEGEQAVPDPTLRYSAAHGYQFDVVPAPAPEAPAPARLVRGVVDTRHYRFEAVAGTREEVEGLLLDAYAVHAARNPYADAGLMASYVDDDEVSWSEIPVGVATIDGEEVR